MLDFTIKKEEHIDYIIENFDFEKVHNVMEYLNWTWWSIGGAPPIENLKKESIRLLNEIYDSDEDYVSISTGGLKVTKFEDYLELEFVLTEWDSASLNYGKRYETLKKNKIRTNKLNKIEKSTTHEDN